MSRPGRLILPNTGDVYGAPDELRLRGLPTNIGHESDPFGAVLAEISRRNHEALVLSATGKELEADLVVTAGHKHNDGDSRILWQQLGSWGWAEDVDDNCREGSRVSLTALTELAVITMRFPMNGAVPIYNKLKTRVRVSNPTPSYVTYTTLYLSGVFSTRDFVTTINPAPLFAQAIQSSAARVYSNEWIEGPTLTFAAADLVTASGSMCLLLSANISTAGDKATLWEMQGAWI
jgi:hypothetical protein